jgi:hypothetical protein
MLAVTCAEPPAIAVHVFHADVALSAGTPRSAQSLERDPTILVGVHDARGALVPLPLDASDVERLALRSPTSTARAACVTVVVDELVIERPRVLELRLAGTLRFDAKTPRAVSGSLAVRGFLVVRGRRFDVDRGVVTFDGRPADDPVVNVSAAYRAPDGTTVFASIVGPVRSTRVTLRSEPPLDQDDILGVLVFGAPAGPLGPSRALGAAMVSEAVNSALRGAGVTGITARVETGATQAPRPAVTIALSERATLTVTRNFGAPAPGESLDPTLVTIDRRFGHGWSLVATLGTRGTTILDLAWVHPY